MGRSYTLDTCKNCGALVKDNWYIKHVKSGCTIGVHNSKNKPFDYKRKYLHLVGLLLSAKGIIKL